MHIYVHIFVCNFESVEKYFSNGIYVIKKILAQNLELESDF